MNYKHIVALGVILSVVGAQAMTPRLGAEGHGRLNVNTAGNLDTENITSAITQDGKAATVYINLKNIDGSKLYAGSVSFVPAGANANLEIVPHATDKSRFSINTVDSSGNKVDYLGDLFVQK